MRSIVEHSQRGPAVSRLQSKEHCAGILDVSLRTALGRRRARSSESLSKSLSRDNALRSVVGERYEFWVLLSPALEAQKVVIAAAAAARKGPAHTGPGLVDRAAALVRVEEAANPAKDRILLAPHRVFSPVILLGEGAPGVLEG